MSRNDRHNNDRCSIRERCQIETEFTHEILGEFPTMARIQILEWLEAYVKEVPCMRHQIGVWTVPGTIH